jgi:hypothetical protein
MTVPYSPSLVFGGDALADVVMLLCDAASTDELVAFPH